MLREIFVALKRKNIWKTLVAYPAASFVILQAVDFFITKYGLDSRALTFTLILLLGGFFVALVWNWFHGEVGSQQYSKKEIGFYSIVTVITVIGAFIFSGNESDSIRSNFQSGEDYRLAVLPFETNLDDESLAYLSEGIPENLINRLSNSTKFQMVSRASTFILGDEYRNPTGVLNQLAANLMLTGKIERIDNTVIVNCQLIDTKNQVQIWGKKVSYQNTNVLQVEMDITNSLIKSIPSEYKKDQVKNSVFSSIPEAQAHYMKGRALSYGSTKAETRNALDHFRDAIRLDPEFVAAYVAIADEQVVQAMFATDSDSEIFNEARLAVQTALQIDPNYAEAYTVDAAIKFYSDRNWDSAEESYKKAIVLDPNNSNALIRYSFFLCTLKRYEEALPIAQQAVKLDPISIASLHGLGWVNLLAGNFEESDKAFSDALEIHPNWIWGYIKRSYALAFMGQYDAAERDTEDARRLMGDWGSELLQSCLIFIYDTCKNIEERDVLADRFFERVTPLNYENPLALGLVYTTLEQYEEALKWHQVAIDENNTGFYQFTVDFAYPLEMLNDPKFMEMKNQLNLPQ